MMIERAPGLLLPPDFPLAGPELEGLLAVLCEVLGLDGADFDLRLVDDVEMAAINAEHRGLRGPTNILSFPADDGPANGDPAPDEALAETAGDSGAEAVEGVIFIGDLVLSVDTLAREAFLYGQDPLEHTARLLAHGLLHLAGFDHGEEMDALTEAAVDAVSGTAADSGLSA
ncbi:metalloprotease ybeY [Desulfovibrio sp. X2]|uniref:rRNA maturation RNase YbeY n=1 Tax=Desulfovibrio sp. X2 TaxID=941449 RepID=UPI000358D977|nr:rRNA maturation RNase YbeY [Desulfovibrio sp. X2]EPR42759.1 metalloprotease ybeY [Desulfovibrio sp. X2]